MKNLISAHEATRILNDSGSTAPTVRCPLEKAVGRVLREAVTADRDLPPFHRVMMDGYAIRHDDRSAGIFNVMGRQMAGEPASTLDPGPGSAMEIMTGAVLPEGADTVIPYEDTEPADSGFLLTDPDSVERGQFVHCRGSDYASGTILLQPGCRIGAVEAGIAASCGFAEVLISQLPRITIFGTGDELVPVRDNPAPHQIRRSNAVAVSAALLAAGFPAGTIEHLRDAPSEEKSRLQEAVASSDIVIISGAVSRGRLDWIPDALDQLAVCRFHGVAQRPGKPMGFWEASAGSCIFALPGNPVSTLVAVHRYVIPFLRQRQGMRHSRQSCLSLASDFHFDRSLTLFLPVKRQGDCSALPCPVNNSGDYAGLAGTDGFVELPAGENHWPAGTQLEFHPWMT